MLQQKRNNSHLASVRRNGPTCLKFCGCPVGFCSVSLLCLEGVWRVSLGCLRVLCQVSMGCPNGCLDASEGQLRTGQCSSQDRPIEVRARKVKTGQVKSGKVKSRQVKFGQIKSG